MLALAAVMHVKFYECFFAWARVNAKYLMNMENTQIDYGNSHGFMNRTANQPSSTSEPYQGRPGQDQLA